ncbi:MAG: hypothetical protein VX112_03295 [Pseudomonadota bacterium]|nr:hypothetical protein [Pseudomonadota bacterium]
MRYTQQEMLDKILDPIKTTNHQSEQDVRLGHSTELERDHAQQEGDIYNIDEMLCWNANWDELHANEGEIKYPAKKETKEPIVGSLVHIFGLLTIYGLVGWAMFNLTWISLVIAGGLNDMILTCASLMVSVFSFIVVFHKPLKSFIKTITDLHVLSSEEKKSIHNRLFQTEGLVTDKYSKAEEAFFKYEVWMKKAKNYLKAIHIRGESRKATEIEEWILKEKLPKELSAQIWLGYSSRLAGSRSDSRSSFLKNQSCVRAAIYELIDNDDRFLQKIMGICHKKNISLIEVISIMNDIFQWLSKEENAERVGRKGFNRDKFYALSNGFAHSAMYISLYQSLRVFHFLRHHIDQKKEEIARSENTNEKTAFKALAKKMIHKLDWAQRSIMPHATKSQSGKEFQRFKLYVLPFVRICLGLVGGGLMVALVANSPIWASSATTLGGKIFLSSISALSGCYASWYYVGKLALKQFHVTKYYWELLSDDRLSAKMHGDFWFTGTKGVIRKLTAILMSTTIAIFTYRYLSVVAQDPQSTTALIWRLLFTNIAPWLQPIYAPFAGLITFIVGVFFFERLLKFYFHNERQDRQWSISNIRAVLFSTINIFEKPMKLAATLVAALQTYVCYNSLAYISPSMYLSTSLVFTCLIAFNAMNRNSYKSFRKSIDQLYKGLFYESRGISVESCFNKSPQQNPSKSNENTTSTQLAIDVNTNNSNGTVSGFSSPINHRKLLARHTSNENLAARGGHLTPRVSHSQQPSVRTTPSPDKRGRYSRNSSTTDLTHNIVESQSTDSINSLPHPFPNTRPPEYDSSSGGSLNSSTHGVSTRNTNKHSSESLFNPVEDRRSPALGTPTGNSSTAYHIDGADIDPTDSPQSQTFTLRNRGGSGDSSRGGRSR